MTGPRAMRQGAANAAIRELLAARKRTKVLLEGAQDHARTAETSYRSLLSSAEAFAADLEDIETALDAMGVSRA